LPPPHLPPQDADWQLLVGDESAVPALVNVILDRSYRRDSSAAYGA
jgi:NADPH-dependent ferric siderophore reductase